MRILFIGSYFPADLKQNVYGCYQRMYVFLEALGRIASSMDILMFPSPEEWPAASQKAPFEEHFSRSAGMPVSLFLTAQDSAALQTATTFRERLRHRLRTFRDPFSSRLYNFAALSGPAQLEAVRACLARRPDLVFVHYLPAIAPVLRAGIEMPPVFYDHVDIEHRKSARYLLWLENWRERLSYLLSILPILTAERSAVKAATCTYVCSEDERRYMAKLCPHSRVEVIPNSVPVSPPSEIPDAATLLFLGFYGYPPNAIAADQLILDIWPRIRSRIPHAALIIAGAKQEALRSYRSAPTGVRFEGFVEDLEALYRRVRVVCCPIRVGGGTRIKIIEAAAHGRPVVSTHVGAEGLGLQDGTEILLRDNPEEFAQACTDLLTDKALCSRLGEAARRKVSQDYDRARVIDRICTSIKGAFPDTDGPR